jgi:hypothetical protein
MRLHVRLPVNRWEAGELWLKKGDDVILGPFDCRGKADNGAAAAHGNPPAGNPSQRDPRKPYGDTPAGKWAACRIVARPHFTPGDGIGPIWIPLTRELADDDATTRLLAEDNPDCRRNLGIHAGRGDGDLMATNGCLRVHDKTMTILQSALRGTVFDVHIENFKPAGTKAARVA